MVSSGLVNLPIKFDRKFIFTLETDINVIFEINIQAAAITASNAAILGYYRSYIQYEQISLDEYFRHYFEGIIMSSKTFRTGMQKSLYQKNYKINSGASSYKGEFTRANRKFNYLDISLVYVKSDAHKIIYDSYDLELASTLTKNV